MKQSFEGPEAGVGAVQSWAGNDDVGEGRQTITASEPGKRIAIKLEFIKPWTATNQTEFTFTPDGEGTRVTWGMDGENDFMGKAFSLFMDMDAMVGKDFEAGLANLDRVSQAKAKEAEAEAQKAEAEKLALEAKAKAEAEAEAAPDEAGEPTEVQPAKAVVPAE